MENAIEPQKNWHDKNYKLLLIIPLALLVFSLTYMFVFYSNHHDFIHKDISLTGGTTVSLYEKVDINDLKQNLNGKLQDVNIREIYDLITNEQKAIIIETKSDQTTTKKVLEDYLKHELTEKNSSFEFTGSTLGEGFYRQLLFAILISFLFMGIVIFLLFKNFIPSIAVISCAFMDILLTITMTNILGLQISTAGIVAFLMLIGYSVDTDILLTNRVLKNHEGALNERIFGAFKTGITMSLAALLSFIVALYLVKSFSNVLTQIFLILSIGVVFDIINTWITNVSIVKWYVQHKKTN